MLKLSPAVSVTGVPVPFHSTASFILFPDSEDADTYYALPDSPNYLADSQGNPSFNLTWFYGGGVQPGGICTMAVALPVPDTNDPKVRDRLLGAINGDAATRGRADKIFRLCQAMEAGDAAQTKALKDDLGFTDAVATATAANFDKKRDSSQFLAGNLQIKPIPFKSGSVTIQAFATPDTYASGSPAAASGGTFQTTPSLANQNAAVVTFNLLSTGVNLFWQALGGPKPDGGTPDNFDPQKGGSSVISVTYHVEFDALLPQATATVTLDKSVVAKLKIAQERHSSWGRTWTEDVVRGKEYNEAINSATEIVLPASATKEDKDSVQKLLTDWAAAQLVDMAKAQLPGVKLEDLDINGARSIDVKGTQKRTYKLTQAISVPKNPQGLLPKMDGLVAQDKLRSFFQLINLNDTPFDNVDVTVRPPNKLYLTGRNVERFVVTAVTYAKQKLRDSTGGEVSVLEYLATDAQKPSSTLKGTFDKKTPDKVIEYEYLVAYGDGTPSYRGAGQQTNNYLDLGSVDLGVLNVTVDGAGLPWDVVNSATVDLKYGDWTKRVTLRNGDKPAVVVQPFGKAMTDKLTYKVTLNLTAGAPFTSEEVSVPLVRGNADLTLPNPLGDRTCAIDFSLDPAVTKAQLRTEYVFKGAGADRVFKQLIQLDATSHPTASWKVPGFVESPGTFRVAKARVTVDGKAVDLTDLSSGTVDNVSDDVPLTVLRDGFQTF